MIRAIAAIERCDVCLLMIDAEEGITDQDKKIAGVAHEAGKGIIVVVNKWDLIQKETNTMRDFQRLIEDERGRELCFEGLRKMDLIRWGKYKEAMEKVSLYATDSRWSSGRQYLLIYATNGATSDRYQWLPIPTRELGLNNLLQQNQAWR